MRVFTLFQKQFPVKMKVYDGHVAGLIFPTATVGKSVGGGMVGWWVGKLEKLGELMGRWVGKGEKVEAPGRDGRSELERQAG